MMKWLSVLITTLFSAAIFANPQVRIYNDPLYFNDKNDTEKSVQSNKQVQNTEAFSSKQPTSINKSDTDTPIPLDVQIKQIDAEILLLKAELARKNGQPVHVKAYLDSLKSTDGRFISDAMKLRINALEQYLQQVSVAENSTGGPYVYNPKNIIVLLPLTGDYAGIGKAIQQGLQDSLPQAHLTFYDTQVFESMVELWNVVSLAHPSFIIGPLRPGKAQVFNDLDVNVPTLLLNQVTAPKSYVRCFSLNRDNYIGYLIKQIVDHQFKGVSLLADETKASQDLLAAFQQQWLAYSQANPDRVKGFRVTVQIAGNSMDQAVGRLVNASQSLRRKNWLQKVVKHRLSFDERSRQDFDVVVSLVSARQAIQVAPLLNFFHLGNIQHYWVPSELPHIKNFYRSLSSWRNTYALLPKYFVDSVKQFDPADPVSDDQVGIFYAFGSVAAKVVESANDINIQNFASFLGEVRFDSQRHVIILPEEYWLNRGRFRLVE